jgi:type I restriction enzyme S subunit
MYPLRPTHETDSRFLLAVVLGEDFSRFASAVSMRSGFPKINRTELAEYRVAWPTLDEQRRIGSVLAVADSQQLSCEAELSKLEQVKAGLTVDLLTGRVRVPEDLKIEASS